MPNKIIIHEYAAALALVDTNRQTLPLKIAAENCENPAEVFRAVKAAVIASAIGRGWNVEAVKFDELGNEISRVNHPELEPEPTAAPIQEKAA